jgi:uncharacterized membrane protein (UPF0127 family)
MVRLACIPAVFLVLACSQSKAQLPYAAEDVVSKESDLIGSPGAPQQLPPPGHAWVIFDADTVLAEVARTPEERERGLMYRENLASGRGMLFVFPEAQVRSFWMSNTFIPLDIAYMDPELRIVDIKAMEPESLESVPSAAPAQFALEVPQGWFEEKGIAIGAVARIVFGPG